MSETMRGAGEIPSPEVPQPGGVPTGDRRTPRPVVPESRLGWWAVGLMCVAGLIMVLNGPLFMSGLFTLRGIGIPIYLGVLGGTALAAALCSLIAMIRLHDRSWLLFFPLVPAALILLLLIGEFGAAALGFGH